MATWSDFREKVSGDTQWRVQDVLATFTPVGELKDRGFKAWVEIEALPNLLEPYLYRLVQADTDQDVKFNVVTESSDGVNTAQDLNGLFLGLWGNIWAPEACCAERRKLLPPLSVGRYRPPGLQKLTSMPFNGSHREAFKKFQISNTAYAPTWGQPSTYVEEPLDESVPFTPEAPDCPFCQYIFEGGEKLDVCPYKEPERRYFGGAVLALLCPNCKRIYDVIKGNYS